MLPPLVFFSGDKRFKAPARLLGLEEKQILQNEDCIGSNFQCNLMHGINPCILLV